MGTSVFLGIFCIGFVFGYLLYYAVRHTSAFNIELLSSAIGTVGSGVVIGWLGKVDGWIGPYGIGLAAGFLFYLVLALFLVSFSKLAQTAGTKVMLLTQNLLGFPPQ